jgi:DNA-binding YbaB/EbfC family protein
MPHELKEAKKIEFDCQRILNEAKLNAEGIIRKAEERAAQIVSREAIVTEAKKKAVDMLTKAQAAAKNLQKNAAESVNKMLADTESHYARNLQSIRMVMAKLSSTTGAGNNGGNPMGGGINVNMIKQAQKMQQDMLKMQEEMENKEYEATVGGGMVKAVVNGKHTVLSVEINPEAIDPEDVEMLQDLVVAAVNQALRKCEEDVASSMNKFTGGMNLVGLGGLL